MAYEYDRFDDESSGGGAFMMGLIAGAVLGAGIGMLLAPKAGSELRSQLGDQASRLRERAAEGYTAASRKVSAASSRVSEMYNARTGRATAPGTDTGSYAGGTAGTSGTSDFTRGGACVRCCAHASANVFASNGGRPASISNVTHPSA
jgi:hypothetical protein